MNLSFIGLKDFPMVEPEDDLVSLIEASVMATGLVLQQDDVIVLAQKIVSKSENRYLDLRTIEVSDEARELALEVDKPAEKVQAILNESKEVVRKRLGVLIVEHRLGFVQANAGIDQSNIESPEEDPESICLLLPEDSDLSAERLRDEIKKRHGIDVAVIINDSLGRAWRMGTMGLAIGVAGMAALESHIGKTDIYGRELMVTEVGVADEMAAGASLVMGQTTQKTPVVLVRGYEPREPEEKAEKGVRPLIRPKDMDMFR